MLPSERLVLMINTSPKDTKKLLQESSFFPSKRLGQNFLVDEKILDKIVASANILETDTVLEIGPGTGTLTRKLSEKAKKVIATEKDEKIIPLLKKNISDKNNISVVNEDILNFPLPKESYKVVANMPYYITSPVIKKLLETKNPPNLLLLTIQKEVALRIIENPPKMNLLALSVQLFGKPEILFHISPSCFHPKPSVSSSLIKITPQKTENHSEDFYKTLFLMAKIAFSHPRKQVKKNLLLPINKKKINTEKAIISIQKAGIGLERRAQTLSVEDWKKIANNYLKQ